MWVSFRVSCHCHCPAPASAPPTRLAMPCLTRTRDLHGGETKQEMAKKRGKFVRYQRQQIPSATHTHTHMTHTHTHSTHTHLQSPLVAPASLYAFLAKFAPTQTPTQHSDPLPTHLSPQSPLSYASALSGALSCNAPIVVANNNEFVI